VTGVVLVIIAGGLLMTAVHAANEGGWLAIGQQPAFSLAWLVRPGTVLSSVVTGVLGVQPYPVRVEVVAWLASVLPMTAFVAGPTLWSDRTSAVPRSHQP
jgi:high-affinity iron transporter